MAKILYISDSSIPSYSANSVHVMKMCHAFAKLGHDVKLLGKNTNACRKDVKDIFAFYGVSENFKLQTFPRQAFPGSGRFYNISMPLLIRSKFDLIYTRSIYAALWCLLLRKEVAFEVHEPFEGKGAFLGFIFKWIVSSGKVRKIIVISQALKNYVMEKYSIPEDNVYVAHDAADPLPLTGETKSLPGEKLFKIGYVGSLLKGKGTEIILPLSGKCPDMDFHIVGGNPSQIEFLKKRHLPGQSNIFFHGFVPHSDTVAYIRSFDVLLAPYQSEVYVKRSKRSNNIADWMSPLKIFEYMSSSIPMVVSDLPVIREVLQNKSNALLCSPTKLSEWIDALKELKKDGVLRKNVAEKALQDFLTSFTWEMRADQILQALKIS